MHQHFAVALVLAALRGVGAGQSEQLEVEVAVIPAKRVVRVKGNFFFVFI